MSIPRIVIAGTNSGCGKTTVTMGVMAALAERGLKVQPYKVGPDYIDPMFHTFITGRESRNLDSWMLDENTVRRLFAGSSGDADIAVVEGVMGFYDGYGGRSLEGSTADVARILGAPVVLVINGEAMSLSAAALVKGFADFAGGARVRGVIINNVSGKGHYELLKEAIEEHTGVTVLGYLQRMDELAIKSRHLGLVTSAEISGLKEKAAILSRQVAETVDLELLLKLAKDTEAIDAAGSRIDRLRMEKAAEEAVKIGKVKIAVARDKAFCFYYKDNLELLEQLGAELIYFSPADDPNLPENIDGLYIGGGYPEIRAEELQDNLPMRKAIKRNIEAGLPAYAECGGLMYLTDRIVTGEGGSFEMAGVIPGRSVMTPSLQRFGYVFVKVTEDNILAGCGSEIRAHEFHYSETRVNREIKECFEVSKRRDGLVTKAWNCGYKVHNLLAGYPHLHFWANPDFAAGFVESCRKYRSKPR